MSRHFASFAVLAFACMVNSQTALADGTVQAAPAAAVQGQTRESFVQGVTGQVLAIMHNGASPLSTKKAQLEQTFMQVVDLNWIAQFVLGKPWDNANQQQRGQYVALYGKYLSSTYLAGLDEKSAAALQDIRVMSMDDAFDDAFIVHTQMVMAQGNNVNIDYLVREDGSNRKVIDITLEGVSLLRTHRSELGALAAAKGMDGVIIALQDKMSRNETHLALAH